MSAEKEIVNFWLNRKGYFTLSNIKSRNKDIGILALKFDKGSLNKIMHVEVCCSITGFIDQNHIFEKIIFEKFSDRNITDAINAYAKNIGREANIENAIVLNSLPKGKDAVIKKLEKNNIALFEFEDILSDVMKGLKTEYFKDDVVRTLQLVKFLLMANPGKFVDILYSDLSPAKRREFIAELLGRDDVIKEFKKTNQERLAIILKQAMIKPERLAEMLEKDILNKSTRKPFIASLIKQEKTGKAYKKRIAIKKEATLNKFFA
ncbi:hypothetical protein HYU09_02870 [Candidatus Woesearchaeota archaeon]|nr:hypothetical protein [Candidatus Woesearchaeota archaeon]